MTKTKAVLSSLLTCSATTIQSVFAETVGEPQLCSRYYYNPYKTIAITHSTTDYLPLITVLVTLAMGIFILRARKEDPPNWLGAARDLGLLFGVPAIVYALWNLVTHTS